MNPCFLRSLTLLNFLSFYLAKSILFMPPAATAAPASAIDVISVHCNRVFCTSLVGVVAISENFHWLFPMHTGRRRRELTHHTFFWRVKYFISIFFILFKFYQLAHHFYHSRAIAFHIHPLITNSDILKHFQPGNTQHKN